MTSAHHIARRVDPDGCCTRRVQRLDDQGAAEAGLVTWPPHEDRRRVPVAVGLTGREPLLLDVFEVVEIAAERPRGDERCGLFACLRLAERGGLNGHRYSLSPWAASEAQRVTPRSG